MPALPKPLYLLSLQLLSTVLLFGSAYAGPRLLLAGGHLPLCSSANLRQCARLPAGWSAARTDVQYRLDAELLERIEAQAPQSLSVVLPVLRKHLDKRPGPQNYHSASALFDAWPAGRTLEPLVQDQFLDFAELAQLRPDGQRRTEQVSLEDSRNIDAVQIYRSFVEQALPPAADRKSRILLLTASARDSYAAVDYYRSTFEQAGAEVRWLPLDAALRAVLDAGLECSELETQRARRTGSVDRARVYPDLHAEQLNYCREPQRLRASLQWADGLFINGGDQSLTRAAWFNANGQPSPELEQLRVKLAAGRLLLGGTSAGTAVQSGLAPQAVMLSNGSSSHALRRGARALPQSPCTADASCAAPADVETLSYVQAGGIGSFQFGVLDTHFSERGRQWRLAALLDQLDLPLGVGVDETTALLLEQNADQLRLQVIGSGAVHWLVPLPSRRKDAALDVLLWRQSPQQRLETSVDGLLQAVQGAQSECPDLPEGRSPVPRSLDPNTAQLDQLMREASGQSKAHYAIVVSQRRGSLCNLGEARWRLRLDR
jgi:cyanophycinase